MRIRLLRHRTIENFMANHANGRKHFEKWLKHITTTEWYEPIDITKGFASNLIGDRRVVFDIGGNGRDAFRIICTYEFGLKNVRLYVNWIGTHEEYNSLTNEQKINVWIY